MKPYLEKRAAEMRLKYAGENRQFCADRRVRKLSAAHALEPTRPLVEEVDLLQLKDKEWRYLWHNAKLRWAIARQVHDIRANKGWTQEDLGQRSGLSMQSICRIENPNSEPPTLSSLIAIARAFDCAFVCRFVAWSEWLKTMAELESGATVSPSFDDEETAGEFNQL